MILGSYFTVPFIITITHFEGDQRDVEDLELSRYIYIEPPSLPTHFRRRVGRKGVGIKVEGVKK